MASFIFKFIKYSEYIFYTIGLLLLFSMKIKYIPMVTTLGLFVLGMGTGIMFYRSTYHWIVMYNRRKAEEKGKRLLKGSRRERKEITKGII